VPRWIHAHHVWHWSKGGPTSLDNLVLLCPRHHRLLHEGNWTYDAGERAFQRPDGRRYEPPPPLRARGPDPAALAARSPKALHAIDGGPLDLAWATGVIDPVLDRLERDAARDAARRRRRRVRSTGVVRRPLGRRASGQRGDRRRASSCRALDRGRSR
jgi:hypothetical protein